MDENRPAPDAPRFRAGALSHRKPTRFAWAPDAAARAALARALDLPAIRALSFKGEILPEGRSDFRLSAELVADVVQSCVISLAPVPARIVEQVGRRFLSEWSEPEGEEVEMPEDDSMDPLPEVIDIAAIAAETLALALPPYPRAAGAELGEAVFAAPGETPIRDEDLKPFAGLASLLKKGEKPGGDPEDDPGAQQ
ncbi:DUF177 domain-containing protein [Pseudogemmobacter humi]|uniref:DUF177 domain-containing protein n=1 Tax=Pseudogemmobacter humi TaxID=2483812 RepID=A0A3P5XMN8_9RHOB|nr:DUF177 domain-containing protein [Pseudogemmobacter humi]VDC31565.1 hypothetical protein XINFAN_02953 [Pseudogemmobacter humi]